MNSLLSLEELAVLNRVEAEPDLEVYFFRKIKKLKWFDELVKREFVNPTKIPSPEETEKGYYTIPLWPVCEYLVNSSEHLKDPENGEYAEKYLQSIRDVTSNSREVGVGNNNTWWKFSQVLRNIPIEFITEEDLENIAYWLDDRFGADLVVGELIDWLVDLQQVKSEVALSLSLKLLPVLFEVNIAPSKYSSKKDEATLKYQSYQLSKFVDSLAGVMGEMIGVPVVDFFTQRLQEVLEINEDDNWSVIWRPAIEDHEQNTRQDDANDFFVDVLRESMLGLCKSLGEGAEEPIVKLLNSECRTIQRVGVYVAGVSFQVLSAEVIGKLLTPGFFQEKYRHETWVLLNNNFNKLESAEKEKVFSIIEDLIPSVENGKPTKEAIAYRHSLWLAAIKDKDKLALELYNKCVETSGTVPDHPSFASYHMTTIGVTNDSPIDATALRILLKKPSDLVSTLNDYEPVTRFNEPDIDGLINAVSDLFLSDQSALFENIEIFSTLKPYFLYSILYSFTNKWSNEGAEEREDWSGTWPKLLEFIYELVKLDSFWQASDNTSGAYIGNVSTVVGEIGRLIEAGCKKDDHSFGVEHIETSRVILETALVNQRGELFDKDSGAVSKAINSPRGKCLEAYINLALYECRNKPGGEAENADIWSRYEGIFTEELSRDCDQGGAEFATIVAMFLPNFRYLSKSWVEDNVDKIFDRSDYIRWFCSMQGYSYVGGFDSATYKLFKKKGYFFDVLDDEFLSEKVGERFIQFMCVGYFRGEENFDGEKNLIATLISRKNDKELKQLVWFVWTMRKSANSNARLKVYELWPKLLEVIDTSTKNGRLLASGLCDWATYVSELDDKTMSWLCAVAPYAQESHNAHFLLESLARLSEEFPFEVCKVWEIMLVDRLDDYPEDAIKTIFGNIILQGTNGVRSAKKIASLYVTHGASRPNEWLNELLEAN